MSDAHKEHRAPGDLEIHPTLVDLWLIRLHERAHGGVQAQLYQRQAPGVLPTGWDQPGMRCAA